MPQVEYYDNNNGISPASTARIQRVIVTLQKGTHTDIKSPLLSGQKQALTDFLCDSFQRISHPYYYS